MGVTAITWIGFGLNLLAALALSLFHLTLDRFSKIALSGHLEERDHPGRVRILDRYDDIKIAVEFWRTIFIVSLGVYAIVLFPSLCLRPLLLLAAATVGYALLFDILPRILGAASEARWLDFFLPSHRLFLGLTAPSAGFRSARRKKRRPTLKTGKPGTRKSKRFSTRPRRKGLSRKGKTRSCGTSSNSGTRSSAK
jgi:hypothetical protein